MTGALAGTVLYTCSVCFKKIFFHQIMARDRFTLSSGADG